jgi:hypothetical protein
MKPEKQKVQTGDSWVDDQGVLVDKKRLFTHETKAERAAVRLFNLGLKIQEELRELAEDADASSEDIRTSYMKHKEKETEEKSSHSFTFYSFNKNIKVEKLVIAQIEYRDEEVKQCRQVFEEFLKEFGTEEDEAKMLKELVLSAFTTKRGKFDSKKLDTLLGYKEKIQNKKFQEAVKLLDESRSVKNTKPYFTISYRDNKGNYVPLNLRLSGVN